VTAVVGLIAIPTAAADMGDGQIAGPRMRFPSQVHKEVNVMRRSLMLVIAVGLATLGSSIAWSDDSDQAALVKALGGAKLTLLQGIAQVAKGTEVPIEAKYEMAHGKLMLSIYTSAKGFDSAAEDNSFNEYIGDPKAQIRLSADRVSAPTDGGHHGSGLDTPQANELTAKLTIFKNREPPCCFR
jgi:hypothetical protein